MLSKLFKTKEERSGLISALLKPVGMVLSLIYTPMLLHYLGSEKYGLWATILSVISWINYFDVGIGNGLRNTVTANIEAGEYAEAKKNVSTAYVILSGVSFVILIILGILTITLNWKHIFSTQYDLRLPLFISFFFICVNFVLALANMLWYALRKPERVSLRNCMAQVINIAVLFILSRHTDGNLVYVAILFGMSSLIMNVVSSIQIMHKHTYLRPSVHQFSQSSIKNICSMGLRFFIIQMMCLLLFTVDDLLITHFFGPEAVTPFSIANKVFNTFYAVLAAYLVPFWSGTTAAIERQDVGWIKSSIKRLYGLLLLFAAGCVLLTFLFHPVVKIWLHKDLNYEPGIVLVMCVFYILFAILTVECQFINGSGKINTQMYMYLIIGILNVPCSIFLGVGLGMRTVGVRLATLVLVAIADVVLGFNLKHIIAELEQNQTAGTNRND